MSWLNPAAADRSLSAPASRAFSRTRRVMLAHVDGQELVRWPLGAVVRSDGQAFRVTRHQGVPPAPGQVDWSFDVWGVQVR